MDVLIQFWSFLTIGFVVTSLGMLFDRLFPKAAAHPTYKRFKPVIPVVLCTASAWIPDAPVPDFVVGFTARLWYFMMAGFATGHTYKMVRRMFSLDTQGKAEADEETT